MGMLEACPDDLPATVDCFSLTCKSEGRMLNVQIENAQIFKDDLTGQILDRAARKKELEYFDAKDVWELKPILRARRVLGKPRFVECC